MAMGRFSVSSANLGSEIDFNPSFDMLFAVIKAYRDFKRRKKGH